MNPETKLKKIIDKARRLKLPTTIVPSTRKGKKYKIRVKDKWIHFGGEGYQDFMDHGDKLRRRNYHNRFGGSKFYRDPTSPLFYSQKLLW